MTLEGFQQELEDEVRVFVQYVKLRRVVEPEAYRVNLSEAAWQAHFHWWQNNKNDTPYFTMNDMVPM